MVLIISCLSKILSGVFDMSSQSIKQKLRSKRRSIKSDQNLFFCFVTIFRMGVVKGVMGVINRLLPKLVRSR